MDSRRKAEDDEKGGVWLDREADAAAAAGGGVGVSDDELGASQFVAEGDLGALQEGDRDRIDQGGLAVAFDAQVVVLGRLDQFEPILEARTPAAVDRDAQHQGPALGRAQFRQAFGGAGGQDDALRRARGDGEGGRGRFCGLDGAHGCLYEARKGVRKGPPASKQPQS